MQNKNIVRENWDNWSDEYYKKSYPDKTIDIIMNNPERAFPAPVYSMIRKHFPDLTGKCICVPSSGDNIAVFAFHLMGAHVTSVDISSRQIENAKNIAKQRSWDIEFVCDDSMELGKIKSNEYDMVYTSNGVHVWITDIPAMYTNFNRIVKNDGCYIFFETHPMSRPFAKDVPFKIMKPYEDIGPFGDVPTYDWRMQDFINAVISSGFGIQRMEEFHTIPSDLHQSHNYFYKSPEEDERDHHRLYDWKQNPWAALPQCFALYVTKNTVPSK